MTRDTERSSERVALADLFPEEYPDLTSQPRHRGPYQLEQFYSRWEPRHRADSHWRNPSEEAQAARFRSARLHQGRDRT